MCAAPYEMNRRDWDLIRRLGIYRVCVGVHAEAREGVVLRFLSSGSQSLPSASVGCYYVNTSDYCELRVLPIDTLLQEGLDLVVRLVKRLTIKSLE